MPRDWMGQKITFATEVDPDQQFDRATWVKAKQGQTIRAIAAQKGHPEWAELILSMNHNRDVLPHPKPQRGKSVPSQPKLHSSTQRLREGADIKLPGIMTKGESLTVHAGNEPPVITPGTPSTTSSTCQAEPASTDSWGTTRSQSISPFSSRSTSTAAARRSSGTFSH
jgi:hypothetical protein